MFASRSYTKALFVSDLQLHVEKSNTEISFFTYPIQANLLFLYI